MRLHHLTATAFGPFADTVSVDFEELNDAGLFLLTGPTGPEGDTPQDLALYKKVSGNNAEVSIKNSAHLLEGMRLLKDDTELAKRRASGLSSSSSGHTPLELIATAPLRK